MMFNEIYWATRLSTIHDLAKILLMVDSVIIICGLFFLGGLLSEVKNSPYDEYNREQLKKYLKKFLIYTFLFFFFFLIAFVCCPSNRDLALIYGWEALTSDTAKDVFERVMEKVGI